jgi:hypothetical protein
MNIRLILKATMQSCSTCGHYGKKKCKEANSIIKEYNTDVLTSWLSKPKGNNHCEFWTKPAVKKSSCGTSHNPINTDEDDSDLGADKKKKKKKKLEKARNIRNLTPVRVTVTRGGKTFQQTVYRKAGDKKIKYSEEAQTLRKKRDSLLESFKVIVKEDGREETKQKMAETISKMTEKLESMQKKKTDVNDKSAKQAKAKVKKQWVIKRDGKVLAVADTENKAYMKLQNIQPHSHYHATTHEGYSIEAKNVKIKDRSDSLTPLQMQKKTLSSYMKKYGYARSFVVRSGKGGMSAQLYKKDTDTVPDYLIIDESGKIVKDITKIKSKGTKAIGRQKSLWKN